MDILRGTLGYRHTLNLKSVVDLSKVVVRERNVSLGRKDVGDAPKLDLEVLRDSYAFLFGQHRITKDLQHLVDRINLLQGKNQTRLSLQSVEEWDLV